VGAASVPVFAFQEARGMSTTLRTSKLIDLCTSSISYDAQVKSACAAFDRQMYQIIDETGVVIMIPNIMGINDPALIDILAWQFHVDFYDANRPLEFRKNLVQKSITWHMRKGTVALVQEVLDTYWPGGATLVEWFDYMDPLPPNYPTAPGWHDRYRFRVYVDENIIVDPDTEQAVLELIDRYKPVSRWCEGVFRAIASDCTIGWCAMLLRFIYREIDAPDLIAHGYLLSGPSTCVPNVASAPFTVALRVGDTLPDPVILTPNDGTARGTFTPRNLTLTTETRTGTFTYTARAAGTVQIGVTNNGGLANPAAITVVSGP
jgi:phage tail P2-like protein